MSVLILFYITKFKSLFGQGRLRILRISPLVHALFLSRLIFLALVCDVSWDSVWKISHSFLINSCSPISVGMDVWSCPAFFRSYSRSQLRFNHDFTLYRYCNINNHIGFIFEIIHCEVWFLFSLIFLSFCTDMSRRMVTLSFLSTFTLVIIGFWHDSCNFSSTVLALFCSDKDVRFIF